MDSGIAPARIALALTSAALIAACEAGDAGSGGPECAHRIAYVTAGRAASYEGSDTAGWEGVRAGAEALGLGEACTSLIVLADAGELQSQVDGLAADNYDIIVTDGFALRDVTRRAARSHPEVAFVGIDQSQTDEGGQPESIDNLAGLVFHEEVEGFLAGALAGLLTETGEVDGLFGCEVIPPTIRYRVGFRNGAQLTNPKADIRIATHPGSVDVCFFDPAYGRREASALVDGGADVIFVAARQTGEGALPVACEAGLVVIASTADPSGESLADYPCAAAAVNRQVAAGVRGLIVAAGDGTFTGGDTFGEVTVRFLPQTQRAVPEEIQRRLAAILDALLAGEIDPCAQPDAGAFCTDI